jgi:hypothetical protein
MLVVVQSYKLWQLNHLFVDFWVNFHVFVINLINYLDLNKHKNVLLEGLIVELEYLMWIIELVVLKVFVEFVANQLLIFVQHRSQEAHLC